MVHSYNVILLSNNKEQSTSTLSNMVESYIHAEQKRTDTHQKNIWDDSHFYKILV